MPGMITGTAGVSPLRLVRPAHDPRRHLLLDNGWSAVGRDLVSPPALFRLRVRGEAGEVVGVAARFLVADPPAGSGLLPHERTDERAVRRRVRALRSAHVDRDPLLLTHRGRGVVPDLVDASAVPLWRHTESGHDVEVEQVAGDRVDAVLAALGAARLLVADGHHRLAASVALAAQGVTTHVTGLVVDADRTPFRLGPVHRVLLDEDGREQLPGDALDTLLGRCRRAGGVVGRGSAPHEGAVQVVHGEVEWHVTWPGHPAGDVTSLVEHVLDDAERTRTRREPSAVAATTAARHGAVAVLLPPPSLDAVLETAERGALLPYKATAFEPKLPSGVLVRPLPAWYAEHGWHEATG